MKLGVLKHVHLVMLFREEERITRDMEVMVGILGVKLIDLK